MFESQLSKSWDMKLAQPLIFILLLVTLTSNTAGASPSSVDAKQVGQGPFVNPQPDFALSPVTGLTRAGWIACGRHMLEGAFSHVKDMNEPMFLPKMPGPGYPSSNEGASRQQRSAAIFEAIARTFNIAATLLREDPDLAIRGIRLKDYYKHHLLQLLTNPDCDYFIGRAADYQSPMQQTCELGNLCVWMLLAPEAFWDNLTKEEKDAVAKTLNEWSSGRTLPHNWRWFNVMMITFLAQNGYPCDREVMNNHLDHLVLLHAGEGWYRDTSCDYYTSHVFQHYAAIWVRYYGRKNDPARARLLDRHMDAFADHYPQIFGRRGEVIMYGRSILYRMGATAGMTASQLRDHPGVPIAPGLARRVASGGLLQFTTHPDFFIKGIPALGFYGPFPPAIQSYSCSASPYWMFGCFSALILPPGHPFWTAKEEAGHWERILPDAVHSEYWSGAGFLVSNHGGSGAAEIRPSKIHNQDPNYSRLVYSSAFPWEANCPDGINAGAITLKRGAAFELPDHVSAAGFSDGVLFRQAEFSGHLPPLVDMASIVIPGGEIRIDRLRRLQPCTVNVGHFSLPHLKGSEPRLTRKIVEGHQVLQAAIPGRCLALTLYSGWDAVKSVSRRGVHPEAKISTVLYATAEDERAAGPVRLMISILLHRTDDKAWEDDELQPIAGITPLREGISSGVGGFRLRLRSGQEFTVDFKDIDGRDSRW